jgi:hypothetical protein
MKTGSQQFLTAVEGYLRRTGTKPTEFGRQAVRDPSLILGLRRGRSPTMMTVDRVLAFIRRQGGPEGVISIGVKPHGK